MKMIKRILPIVLCILLSGCSEEQTPEPQAVQEQVQEAVTAKNPISRETTKGPVHAEVVLDNEKPVLGELVDLTLRVTAADGIRVIMPEFGDQLGRFSISDYKDSRRILDDGRTEYVQTYKLDLPRSGRMRTPSFLVEFVDNRQDSSEKGKIQEILTEEISFEIASIFAAGEEMPQLYPAAGALPELVIPKAKKSFGLFEILAVSLCGLCVGGLLLYRYFRKAKKVEALPAHVVALGALDVLKNRGLPSNFEQADTWYVDLSSIVRRYIEQRFALEAPCMTTEEFIELAGHSDAISVEHKQLLHRLLERSDRVKFTKYVPSSEESQNSLDEAGRFVTETMTVEEEKNA